MAERRNPTNSDILKEIKLMNQRVLALEQWKLSEDAYRAALKQIKTEDEATKYTTLRDGEITIRTKLWKQALIAVGLAILLLQIYLTTKGKP